MPPTQFSHRFRLSGFADEIADDLDTQLDVLQDLGIDHLDLRGVDGTNVLDLSADEVDRIRTTLDQRGFTVSCIGSPIGKVGIESDFEAHLDRFHVAMDRAVRFDTPYIRLFSYWMPEDEDPATYREEVMDRMRAKVDLAAERDLILLHENEKDLYGDTPGRCRDMLETIDSPHLRAIFDPANFLEVGVHPYPDALLDLVEHVEYLHVKDAHFGERGAIEPAGAGDAQFVEILDAFRRRGFSGFASLEPHLAEVGEKGGFSGPEAFETAMEALRACLDEVGATYE